MARQSRQIQGTSIAQLADHLGLSQGTVSRALNGYSDIAPQTRQRVSDAARELNYRPSSLARRLARGEAETVGFVLPARTGHVTDPFLAEVMDGVAIELAEHDWDLIVAPIPDGIDDCAVLDRLIRSGKVGGIILTRTRRRDPRVEFLLESGVPFVTHGRTEADEGYCWFDIDNEKAFEDAVTYLVELGHRRIAHLGGDPDINFAHKRAQGYRRGMAARGLPLPEDYLVFGCVDTVTGKDAMAGLLELPEPPTAVVCVTDTIALGAMRAIVRAGLQPGREVSVIGYDGLPAGLAADPPLTTMAQSSHAAGREISRMLLAQIAGTSPPVSHRLWEATLTPRASANPPVEWPAAKPHGRNT